MILQREDYRRYSLYLSTTLTLGVARVTHEQLRKLLLDITGVRGNVMRSIRNAKGLNENQIDLTPTNNPNQTQLVFDDNTLVGVLAETEKPGVDLVQSPLINPEALPDNHLLEENDLPRRSRTFDFLEDSPENPEDPFGENFGRGKTMILTMVFGLVYIS